jgi:NAD(P)-dependent dehydrogenase (short-subunit alcohol dehydrogenase family)
LTSTVGQFFLVEAVRPHLKAGAAIINCRNIPAYQGEPEALDYSSTRRDPRPQPRLVRKVVGEGIRVNAVAHGPIWTQLNPSGSASPGKLKTFGEKTPMGRPG